MRQDIAIADGTVVHTLDAFPFDSSPNLVTTEQGYRRGDRAVDAWTMQRTFAQFFSDGVFGTPSNAFQISKAASGLAVTVQPGMAVIQGAMGGIKESDGAMTLTLDTGAVAGNVCYGIMLRYDNNSDVRSLGIRAVKGVAGSNPQPPAPDTTSAGVMELRLGYVTVPNGATDLSNATVTNEKGLTVCPYAAPFEEIDVSEVTADAKAAANEALAQLLDYFETYRQMVDDAVDGTLAGSLQTQITALQQQLDNFDLSGSVDSETVVYNVLPGSVDKKLRVNQLSLSKDYLTVELQTELGILDTSGWDFDTYYSTAQGLSGATQDQYIESIPAGAVNTWTAAQLKQMIDLVSDEADESLISKLSSSTVAGWSYSDISQFFGMSQPLEASFIEKIPNSAVNSWEFDQIKSSFQAVNDQNLPALSAKVDTSTIQSWNMSQDLQIVAVADDTFNARVTSAFPFSSCSWSELDDILGVLPTSSFSSLVGKTKTSGSASYVAIGANHDDLVAGGKAHLTFMRTTLYATSSDGMRYSDNPVNYANTTMYNALEEDLRQVIKQVKKRCYWSSSSSSSSNTYKRYTDESCYCFELSAKECGNVPCDNSIDRTGNITGYGYDPNSPNCGTAYQWFSDSNAATRRASYGAWWNLRDIVTGSHSPGKRCAIANNGLSGFASLGTPRGRIPAFCV